MMRSTLNPKPSDYTGQYRLAGIAFCTGVLLLVFGVAVQNEWLNTIMVSAGVGLLIGGGAIILSAMRSQRRSREAEDE